MAKALLLLGLLLILVDVYENIWLKRTLRSEDRIPGGQLFKLGRVRIYRAHLGGILILIWWLVR